MTRFPAAPWGLLSIIAFGGTGCSTMNNTEKGALAGTAIGAGAGTLIGAATGHAKTGAVVGGLLGAGVGGIAGNQEDKKERQEARIQQANATQAYAEAQPQRINEVIELARSGQSDQVIINHIRANHMTFVLSSADLNTLKANGVPDRVILEMQSPPRAAVAVVPQRRPREVVYVADPYCAPPPPVVFVRPPPPPPVVGVGFTFRR